MKLISFRVSGRIEFIRRHGHLSRGFQEIHACHGEREMQVHDWDWDVFPETDDSTCESTDETANARANASSLVLGEMAAVLLSALGLAFAVNIALTALHVS